MTGLRFGRLAATSVDVLARQKVGQTRVLGRGDVGPEVRVLRGIGELVVE